MLNGLMLVVIILQRCYLQIRADHWKEEQASFYTFADIGCGQLLHVIVLSQSTYFACSLSFRHIPFTLGACHEPVRGNLQATCRDRSSVVPLGIGTDEFNKRGGTSEVSLSPWETVMNSCTQEQTTMLSPENSNLPLWEDLMAACALQETTNHNAGTKQGL